MTPREAQLHDELEKSRRLNTMLRGTVMAMVAAVQVPATDGKPDDWDAGWDACGEVVTKIADAVAKALEADYGDVIDRLDKEK